MRELTWQENCATSETRRNSFSHKKAQKHKI
jgi:hypothetical protein